MLGVGNEEMSTIPGFNQIQFEGFCRFIDRGLTEELYKFPTIEDTDQEIEFQLFVERYQLVEPLIKERDAVYESLTYSSELYVSAGLIWKTSRLALQEKRNRKQFIIFYFLFRYVKKLFFNIKIF